MQRETPTQIKNATQFLLAVLIGLVGAASTAAQPASLVMVTQGSAGRLDYNRRTGVVAFDDIGRDGLFDVWRSEYSGADRRCLTCALTPHTHRGRQTTDGHKVAERCRRASAPPATTTNAAAGLILALRACKKICQLPTPNTRRVSDAQSCGSWESVHASEDWELTGLILSTEIRVGHAEQSLWLVTGRTDKPVLPLDDPIPCPRTGTVRQAGLGAGSRCWG